MARARSARRRALLPRPRSLRFSLENSPDPSSSRARRTEISGITRVDDSDRSFFRFRAEIFFDVRAVWKFRRSGPRTRRWVWKRKTNPNLRPSILSSPSRHLKFERSDADPRPIKRPERRHAKKRRMALAARGALPRHISTRVYASAHTHPNVKMACMSLSMKVAVAASESPRARSSHSATARVESRVASTSDFGVRRALAERGARARATRPNAANARSEG
jgi:hypothetical protein